MAQTGRSNGLVGAGLLVMCVALAVLEAGPAAAQQSDRDWMEISDEMYPQPDDPGTLAEADIATYLQGLKGTLSDREVDAFHSAMAEEMHNFQFFCPRTPTYLIDYPAEISEWGDVLLRGLTFPSRTIRYWVQTCKASFPMTVFLVRDATGGIQAARGLPGFTLTNLSLQVDTEPTMELTVAQMRPESCNQAPQPYFTRVVAYAESVHGGAGFDFLEEWSVLACGKLYHMEVELTYSPGGGVDFSFFPLQN